MNGSPGDSGIDGLYIQESADYYCFDASKTPFGNPFILLMETR
jgi:hypothetical protein